MNIPGLQAIEKIISEAIEHVYTDVNTAVDQGLYVRDLTGSLTRRYLDFLTESTRYVTLIGHSSPVEARDIFVEPELTFGPQVRWGSTPASYSALSHARESTDSRRLPALRALQSRSLVIGPPGVGKSTLARIIALSAARHVDFESPIWSDKLPFYFAVKDLSPIVPTVHHFDWRLALQEPNSNAPNKTYLQRIIEREGKRPVSYLESLMSTVLRQSGCERAEAFVQHLLEKGSCCVIVDGLDEATDELKEVLIGSLTHIRALFPSNSLMAFSRPRAVPDGIPFVPM